MKTPDEIKGGMLAHVYGSCTKEECPYWKPAAGCCDEMLKDALAYIQQLEKRLADVNASPFDGGMSQQEYFGIK